MPEIRCYRSPKIKVRSSSLQGRGVFATEKIEQGEVVAVKAGHIITADQLLPRLLPALETTPYRFMTVSI